MHAGAKKSNEMQRRSKREGDKEGKNSEKESAVADQSHRIKMRRMAPVHNSGGIVTVLPTHTVRGQITGPAHNELKQAIWGIASPVVSEQIRTIARIRVVLSKLRS